MWPLQQIANKGGACQGLVGISRAFFLNADFRSEDERLSEANLMTRLKEIIKRQRHETPGERIVIPGFSNLRELCDEYRPWFEKKSVYENAYLTLRDTARHYPQLVAGPDHKDQRRNIEALDSIQKRLKSGSPSLMLYPSHVVMVIGMDITSMEGGRYKVVLELYDPNDNVQFRFMTFFLNHATTQTLDGVPIFDVTPKNGKKD